MRRCIVILSMVLTAAMLSWGQVSEPSTRSAQDTLQSPSRLQQFKERIIERAQEKLNEPYDTTRNSGYWWRAMKHAKVNFNDSTMGYPRFVKFCYKTYVWGDRTFNSYDSAYVKGTGKNWKLILKSDNWMDSYIGKPFQEVNMVMNSRLVSNIGVSLSFMAVSVGYSVAVSNLIHGSKVSNKVDFSFTCARFAADAYYWENSNEVNVTYTHKGVDEGRHHFRMSGITRKAMGATAYYFFNNRRYAQAAAYCYSKYQRRSAGSWLAGASVQHFDVKFDVEQLPEASRVYIPTQEAAPRILYNDYCVLVGYGHNWVLSDKWLFNLTLTPYIGYRYNINPYPGIKQSDISINMRGLIGAVYNHKQFFLGLQGYADHHRYHASNSRMINSIIDFTVLTGIRF